MVKWFSLVYQITMVAVMLGQQAADLYEAWPQVHQDDPAEPTGDDERRGGPEVRPKVRPTHCKNEGRDK